MKTGNGFITNGPLLTFEVDGHTMGDVVEFSEPRAVSIQAEASSQLPFSNLEIVLNGEVVQTASKPEKDEQGIFRTQINGELTLRESSLASSPSCAPDRRAKPNPTARTDGLCSHESRLFPSRWEESPSDSIHSIPDHLYPGEYQLVPDGSGVRIRRNEEGGSSSRGRSPSRLQISVKVGWPRSRNYESQIILRSYCRTTFWCGFWRSYQGYKEPTKYRACVIGDTKHGGYGHNLHLVWGLHPEVEVVALADPDEAGRAKRAAEAGAQRTYADYRVMLEKEQPDLVSIGPRWTVNHLQYILDCTQIGAHGLIEKPLSVDLAEADAIIEAVEAKDLRWAIGFNFRASPVIAHTRRLLIEEGLIGDILEIRSRGKEDHRAGGEDLIVLGVHLFDMMVAFLGPPLWCSSSIDGGWAPCPA